MMNGVCITDFKMANKDEFIGDIKSSNAIIQALKEIKIRSISWRAKSKKEQELALLVMKFLTLGYSNNALDYNILIEKRYILG